MLAQRVHLFRRPAGPEKALRQIGYQVEDMAARFAVGMPVLCVSRLGDELTPATVVSVAPFCVEVEYESLPGKRFKYFGKDLRYLRPRATVPKPPEA
ncbi:MAG TPA: hypothetical protein GXX28_01995 [Firmicutes bacterium]|nr:hypothetical protein [Bacillota bacterium]